MSTKGILVIFPHEGEIVRLFWKPSWHLLTSRSCSVSDYQSIGSKIRRAAENVIERKIMKETNGIGKIGKNTILQVCITGLIKYLAMYPPNVLGHLIKTIKLVEIWVLLVCWIQTVGKKQLMKELARWSTTTKKPTNYLPYSINSTHNDDIQSRKK